MSFSICLSVPKSARYKSTTGMIRIGAFRESFEVTLIEWKCCDYLAQWTEALGLIARGHKSCLMTDTRGLIIGTYTQVWCFYPAPKGGDVTIRNCLLKNTACKRMGDWSYLRGHCPIRNRVSQMGNISEWRTSLESIRIFANAQRWKP